MQEDSEHKERKCDRSPVEVYEKKSGGCGKKRSMRGRLRSRYMRRKREVEFQKLEAKEHKEKEKVRMGKEEDRKKSEGGEEKGG